MAVLDNVSFARYFCNSREAKTAAVRRAGGTAEVLAIDIGDADAPQRAIDAAVERWARLDIIVHNAAFVPYGPMSEMADETFMRAFAQNSAAFG